MQFEIIEYFDLLIVVIDENVTFYSLYSPRELGNPFMDQSSIQFNINKLFDVDEEGRGTILVTCSRVWSDGLKKKLFIAFGKRRKISLFQWKGIHLLIVFALNVLYIYTYIGSVASNLQNKAFDYFDPLRVLKKYNDYPIPVKPRLLILAGKRMFVGFKEQYDLIDLETSSKKMIFETGKRSSNVIGIRLINKEVLLVVDNKGYFVNYKAKLTRSKCVEWTDIPLAVTYFHPYIVSVLPNCLEIHHVATSNLIHKFDFKNGKYASSVSYQSSSIWTSYLSLSTGSLSSSNHIVSLLPSLISDQLKYLKENKLYEEALKTITLYDNMQFEQEGLDKEIKTNYINYLQ